MSEHRFIRQSRKEANNIIEDPKMSRDSKRELLRLISARADGAGLILDGNPELFRALCDFSKEIMRTRDEVL